MNTINLSFMQLDQYRIVGSRKEAYSHFVEHHPVELIIVYKGVKMRLVHLISSDNQKHFYIAALNADMLNVLFQMKPDYDKPVIIIIDEDGSIYLRKGNQKLRIPNEEIEVIN